MYKLKRVVILLAMFMLTMNVMGDDIITYEKVTTAPDDWSGEYLIVYEYNANINYILDGSADATTLKASSSSNGVLSARTNGCFTDADKYHVTISKASEQNDNYSIKTASNYYIGHSSSSASLDVNSSTEFPNTITLEADGNVTIKSGEYTLSFYYSSKFFRYYNNSKYITNLYLYKKTIHTSDNITISDVGYGTYYNSKTAYIMPEGCEGLVAYYDTSFHFEKAYSAGDVVPAGTALVLKNRGEYVLTYATGGEQPTNNDLLGTDVSTAITGDQYYYFYALSLDSNKTEGSVGFYWMNDTGMAFTNGAHKAYLKIAKSNFPKNAKSGFAFNDSETEGIINVCNSNGEANVYNLQGQRVSPTTKGILIQNGRKFIVK